MMAYLGIRISDELRTGLEKAARKTGRNMSDLAKEALESYCLDILSNNMPENDWRTLIWSFFDVSMTRVEYAHHRSKNAEEFFGFIAQWLKESKIHLTSTQQEIIVVLTLKNGMQMTARHGRNVSKDKIISGIIHKLEQSFTEATLEEI